MAKRKSTAAVIDRPEPRALSQTLVSIPIGDLVEQPTNRAIDPNSDDIKELADSIAENGLLQPLVVAEYHDGENDGYYMVVAGHRRLAACRLLRMTTVPCALSDISAEDIRTASTVENIQRQNLAPLEEAEQFAILAERHTLEQIAQRVGKTPNYVAVRKNLANLIDSLKEALRMGALPLANAIEIARMPSWLQDKVEESHYHTLTGPIKYLRDFLNKQMMVLGTAPWNLADADTPGGACLECPFNTACNKALFADVEDAAAGRCTSPVCWVQNMDAYRSRLVVQTTERLGTAPAMLSNSWQVRDGIVHAENWKEVESGTEGARLGVVIDDENRMPAARIVSYLPPVKATERHQDGRPKEDQSWRKEQIREFRVETRARYTAALLVIERAQLCDVLLLRSLIAIKLTNTNNVVGNSATPEKTLSYQDALKHLGYSGRTFMDKDGLGYSDYPRSNTNLDKAYRSEDQDIAKAIATAMLVDEIVVCDGRSDCIAPFLRHMMAVYALSYRAIRAQCDFDLLPKKRQSATTVDKIMEGYEDRDWLQLGIVHQTPAHDRPPSEPAPIFTPCPSCGEGLTAHVWATGTCPICDVPLPVEPDHDDGDGHVEGDEE